MSLRGGGLRLLALRGRFDVEGVTLLDVELRTGMTLTIADIPFTIVAVVLPSRTLGLELPGLGAVALPPVASLRSGPTGVELRPGFVAEADAVVWHDGDGHRVRTRGGAESTLGGGDVLALGSHRVLAVWLPRADSDPTAPDEASHPLELTLRHDTVHVHHHGRRLTIDGVPARLVTELALIGQPVEWRVVAGEIWSDEDDETALRRRWDRGLARLRATLRSLGLREDLVRRTGAGRVELYLHPGDTVVDQT